MPQRPQELVLTLWSTTIGKVEINRMIYKNLSFLITNSEWEQKVLLPSSAFLSIQRRVWFAFGEWNCSSSILQANEQQKL